MMLEENRQHSCHKRFGDLAPASATVAVLGQRLCEYQWRHCKATDRHYVVEPV